MAAATSAMTLLSPGKEGQRVQIPVTVGSSQTNTFVFKGGRWIKESKPTPKAPLQGGGSGGDGPKFGVGPYNPCAEGMVGPGEGIVVTDQYGNKTCKRKARPNRPNDETFTFSTNVSDESGGPIPPPVRYPTGAGAGGGAAGGSAGRQDGSRSNSLAGLSSLLAGAPSMAGGVGIGGGIGGPAINEEPGIEDIPSQLMGSEASAGHIQIGAPGSGREGLGQRLPPSLAALLKMRVY